MVMQCDAILLGTVFVVLVALGLIKPGWRPPMTLRGRVFYCLLGNSGIYAGVTWLGWNAVACGADDRIPPQAFPTWKAFDVLGRMVNLEPHGYLVCSLAALAFCAVGLRLVWKAAFGVSYVEGETGP